MKQAVDPSLLKDNSLKGYAKNKDIPVEDTMQNITIRQLEQDGTNSKKRGIEFLLYYFHRVDR